MTQSQVQSIIDEFEKAKHIYYSCLNENIHSIEYAYLSQGICSFIHIKLSSLVEIVDLIHEKINSKLTNFQIKFPLEELTDKEMGEKIQSILKKYEGNIVEINHQYFFEFPKYFGSDNQNRFYLWNHIHSFSTEEPWGPSLYWKLSCALIDGQVEKYSEDLEKKVRQIRDGKSK